MPADQGKFGKPPSGTALNADSVRALVSGPGEVQAEPELASKIVEIEDVAKALGGVVTSGGAQDTQRDIPSAEGTEPEPEPEEIDVDMADRREYIRSLLADELFHKKYELFGGGLHATFKTRTTEENDQVDIDLRKPELAGLVQVRSAAIVRERLRMVASCSKLSVGGRPTAVSMDAFNKMNEVTFAAIRTAFRDFERICDVMFEKANDADFWNGTDGAI